MPFSKHSSPFEKAQVRVKWNKTSEKDTIS